MLEFKEEFIEEELVSNFFGELGKFLLYKFLFEF